MKTQEEIAALEARIDFEAVNEALLTPSAPTRHPWRS